MPRLPFDTLQGLDLPIIELICSRLNFVHDFFMTFPYEVRDSLPSDTRDLVVLLGKKEWRERLHELSGYPGRVVLVFAQGDAPLRDVPGSPSLPPNVAAAYATNNELADDRVVGVPLGVRINKVRALQFVRQNRGGAKNGLLYGNFTLNDLYYRPDRSGVPHVRARLVDRLRGAPWASLDISDDHREDPADQIRFYAQTASHRFVLSPEGSGIDCYRTWESLYLGAIPIVMVSPTMSAFGDLPILFTEDYSELTEAYLERRWEEMSRRSFEVERLLSSYYLRRFLASVAALKDPRFICWKVDDSILDGFIVAMRRSSLLAGSIVAETPTPPFVNHERGLLAPDAWYAPGAMRLERAKGGLRILAEEGERAVADAPLQTIAGAPFRLSGEVLPETDGSGGLILRVADGREGIAALEVGNGHDARFELEFVARSARTVVSLRAPRSAGNAVWRASDLSIDVTV
jgi:hypothetical protein